MPAIFSACKDVALTNAEAEIKGGIASKQGNYMRRTTKQMASWMRILCAVALLSVGFAHKPVASYAASAPQSQAYQLPDGSFADLCTIHEGDQHKGTRADHGCEACRLSASLLLPAPLMQAGELIRIATELSLFERADLIRHRLYPPNSGPRAPPNS